MLNMFLFLSLAFLFTIVVGRMLERIRVPWIFAALLLGTILAVYNPFTDITSSETFSFLAQLGMYFLLFMIGFEINLKDMKKKGRFLFKATFFIIFLESFFGTLLIHFVFGYEWLISFLVALSFATVGEAILIPILQEFRMVNTRLGQSILGIGLLDDIIEVIALILVVALVGSSASHSSFNIGITLVSLFVMFVLSVGLTQLGKSGQKFSFMNVETLFIFSIFILFLFLGVGQYAEATPLAAFLAGMGLRTFIHGKRLELIESEVKTVCYGLFAPIFFLWIGASMDIGYIAAFPLLILLVVAVSNGSKILGSWVVARKELGHRESIMLGLGISVRFSTSIIIIKILFDSGLIGIDLFSVVVASSIIFTFFIPLVFSNLLLRFNVVGKSGNAQRNKAAASRSK